jgi:hypothetical protein
MSSDFFASMMEDLYGLYAIEPPREISTSVYFTLKSGLQIAFEMSDHPQGLLLAAELGPLTRAASRSLWIQEALRWNGSKEGIGQVGLNKSQDLLVCFHLFPLVFLNAQSVFETIPKFEERALLWKSAVENGYPPALPGSAQIQGEEFNPFRAGSAAGRFVGTLRP